MRALVLADAHVRSGRLDRLSLAVVDAARDADVVDGVSLALVHETGPTPGRPRRVRRRFPDADVVVFGHSHAACVEWTDGQLLFNPGSPTERRREPVRTCGWLEVEAGRILRAEVVPLP